MLKQGLRGMCALLFKSKDIFKLSLIKSEKKNTDTLAGCLRPASAPQISCSWHTARELKATTMVVFTVADLSLTIFWSLSPLSPREHMAPQAGGEQPLEGQHLQAVSLPSAGACGEGATAGGAPRLPASPQPCPGPQAATCPEGPPLGTAW